MSPTPAPGSVTSCPWVAICPAQGAHFVTLLVSPCAHPVHTAVLSAHALGLGMAVWSAVLHEDPLRAPTWPSGPTGHLGAKDGLSVVWADKRHAECPEDSGRTPMALALLPKATFFGF